MRDDLSVLAAPVRREILRLVWDAERSAGQIAKAFEITFGAVSQHLKILREAGLVEVRRDGPHRFYLARKEEMGPIRELLEAMWTNRLKRLRVVAEERERGEAR